MLSIADDFYQLNNIKVNKEKSVLMAKQQNKKNMDPIALTFGNEQITITPISYQESTHFLGVWLNLAGNRQFIIQQARDEVLSTVNVLKTKFITDKQLLYIYNMVVIPRIEYRAQLTHLNQRDCDVISAPFRKFFKNKIHLSSSAPNAILLNNAIYKFRDLYEVMFQSKITNFTIQINDHGLLGRINDIRLKQIQSQEWLGSNPLVDWPFNKIQRSHLKTFLKGLLSMCKFHQISFDVDIAKRNVILGGQQKFHLQTILDSQFDKVKKQFINNNIMYLDQLTS